MATPDRIRQNFVRQTLQTCPQYQGNLAEGAAFAAAASSKAKGRHNQKKVVAVASAAAGWACTVCSVRNAAADGECAACARPRVPAWSKFPSGVGVRVGMYVQLAPGVAADAASAHHLPEDLRRAARTQSSGSGGGTTTAPDDGDGGGIHTVPAAAEKVPGVGDRGDAATVGIVVAVDFIVKAVNVIFAVLPTREPATTNASSPSGGTAPPGATASDNTDDADTATAASPPASSGPRPGSSSPSASSSPPSQAAAPAAAATASASAVAAAAIAGPVAQRRGSGGARRGGHGGGGALSPAVLPGAWFADGKLGAAPLQACPAPHAAVFGEYHRCANPACCRVFRLQNADTRLLTPAERQEALAQARFVASKVRTLEEDKAKFLQVKDKAGVAQCAADIAARKAEQGELLRRGADMQEWCPFCTGPLGL